MSIATHLSWNHIRSRAPDHIRSPGNGGFQLLLILLRCIFLIATVPSLVAFDYLLRYVSFSLTINNQQTIVREIPKQLKVRNPKCISQYSRDNL